MPVTAPADRRFRRAHVKPARHRRAWPGRLARLARAATAAAVVGAAGYHAVHAAADAHALQVATIRVLRQPPSLEGEVLALVEGLRGQHICSSTSAGGATACSARPWIARRRSAPGAAVDGGAWRSASGARWHWRG